MAGVDPLSLSGANDANIKVLQKQFKAQIVLRGNEMLLDGEKHEIKLIELLVRNILVTINRKGFVEPGDLTNFILDAKNEKKEDFKEYKEDPVVLYTHKGTIFARTRGQKKYLSSVEKNDIIFAIGPAGTGKTYQAVASAVAALKSREIDRIVITRPAVEAGERLGFLPGDLKEKVDPYLTPLYDALNDMIPRDKLKVYLDQMTIEIAPLAYMRGRTLNNSFIILDEAQNVTPMQMKMFLTRLGITSKAIITGDITQIDLDADKASGLVNATEVIKNIDGIDFVYFDENDVVRHNLVKRIIKAYALSNKKGNEK